MTPALWLLALGTLVVAAVVVWRYRTVIRRGSGLPPGVGGTRLVGMTAEVVRTVGGRDQEVGAVRVLGDVWPARTRGRVLARPGTTVRIVDVEGTRVVVEAVPDETDRTGSE